MSSIRLGNVPNESIGLDIDLESLTDNFSKIFSKFRILVDYFHAFTDPMTGDIFLNIADASGHSIDAILTLSNDGIPGCTILDANDKEVAWIDLEGVAPVNNGRIDFGMGKWFRYSILSNLLKLGNIEFDRLSESKSNQVITTINKIEEAFSFNGMKRTTVVSHRSRNKPLTTRQIIGLESARRKAKGSIIDDASNQDSGDNVRAEVLSRHLSKFLYQKLRGV